MGCKKLFCPHRIAKDDTLCGKCLEDENEQLRAALRRAHQWLSTSGMDATPAEIEAECAVALGLNADGT